MGLAGHAIHTLNGHQSENEVSIMYSQLQVKMQMQMANL